MENNNRLSELIALQQYVKNSIDRARSETLQRESFEDLDSKFRNEIHKETGSVGQYLRDLQITDRKQASLCQDAFSRKSTSKRDLRMRYDDFTKQFLIGIGKGIRENGGGFNFRKNRMEIRIEKRFAYNKAQKNLLTKSSTSGSTNI